VDIIDKDRATRPAYLTWALVSRYFKGYDARTVGDLILADGPSAAVEESSPDDGYGGAKPARGGRRSPD
jgi:hypothetical protein